MLTMDFSAGSGNSRVLRFAGCFLGVALAASAAGDACGQDIPSRMPGLQWTHFTIADPLPGSSWGTGGIPLIDLDGDGDLDVVISRQETQTAYWFERKDDATWIRHVIGTSKGLERTLGAAAVDIKPGWPAGCGFQSSLV